MQLEVVVTLASPEVRLRFIAMERSLRATGCNLPLRVIPYNEGRFDLPPNAEWWLDEEMADWLSNWKAHPAMRKCQCLTIPNFQFVDADVVFLRNPAEVLQPMEGFVTSCGHWRDPCHTFTPESLPYLKRNVTMWQKWVFNSGQWACDRALFTAQSLRLQAEAPEFKATCFEYHYCDQPGINLLVRSTETPIHNLTFPPWNMQSTWAGDYFDEFRPFWNNPDEMPYLIHWAGCRMEERRPIDELMEQFLSADELGAWRSEVSSQANKRRLACKSLRSMFRRLKRASVAFAQSIQSG